MRYAIEKAILTILIKVRWMYFHVSPMYVKFYFDSTDEHGMFQHRKHGTLHANYLWASDEAKEQ